LQLSVTPYGLHHLCQHQLHGMHLLQPLLAASKSLCQSIMLALHLLVTYVE